MQRVYSGELLLYVESMKNVLEMHNIQAEIRNQYLSAASGEIPVQEAWPELWVADEDAAKATQIIKEALQEASASKAMQTCPKCGEESEEQFAVCWNCGATLTD